MKLIDVVKEPVNPVLIKSHQTVEFKIGDMSKIIEILRSKIYSHPIRTLVQEYLSNARDAVREVNGSKIIVTLPTDNDPVLHIRDFGPGISKDRMLNTFVQYGNTTKGDTNKQTGGFGLGSKLAWAYTDQFSIITFVDGVETCYLAHISKNKNGSLELISETKTQEPNGTEISIPVQPQDFDEFTKAVQRAVIFWKDSEKPELIGGSLLSSEVLHLSKGIDIYPKSIEDLLNHDRIIIAVDGIGYPLSRSFINNIFQSLQDEIAWHAAIVFHVGNGQIEVSASRESITEDNRIKNVLKSKVSQAIDNIKALIETLPHADSLKSFVSEFSRLRNYLSVHKAEFKDGSELFCLEQGYSVDELSLTSPLIEKLDLLEINSRRRKCKGFKGINLRRTLCIKDEVLSIAKQTQKVEYAHLVSPVVIGKGENTEKYLLDLGNKLGGIRLSSIVLPKVQRAEIQKLPEGHVKAQIFVKGDYHSRKTLRDINIDLSNQGKYVYFTRDEQILDLRQYASLRNFLNNNGIQLCFMGPKAIKAVKGNKNFVYLKDFLAKPTLVIRRSVYNTLIKKSAGYLLDGVAGKLEFLTDKKAMLLKKVHDKKLRTDLNRIREIGYQVSYDLLSDDFLMTHLVKTSQLVAEAKALGQSVPSYIAKNYPLLKNLREPGRYDDVKPIALKVWQAEVVAYLNGSKDAR